VRVREGLGMTDIRAATDMEVASVAGTPVEATGELPMPPGVMVYVVIAFGAEALWHGLIGWWLLHLF
jgi:hypothetical protein